MLAAGYIGLTCTGRQAFYANLHSFQVDLESIGLLAYSGGHSDVPGSTVTEALHLGAAPLHDVIRQICDTSKELAMPPVHKSRCCMQLGGGLPYGSRIDHHNCVQSTCSCMDAAA